MSLRVLSKIIHPDNVKLFSIPKQSDHSVYFVKSRLCFVVLNRLLPLQFLYDFIVGFCPVVTAATGRKGNNPFAFALQLYFDIFRFILHKRGQLCVIAQQGFHSLVIVHFPRGGFKANCACRFLCYLADQLFHFIGYHALVRHLSHLPLLDILQIF